jgi:hypothetical protein
MKCRRKWPGLFVIDVGSGDVSVDNRMLGGYPPSERGTLKTTADE